MVAKRKRRRGSRADIDCLGRTITYKITPLRGGVGARYFVDGRVVAQAFVRTRADAQAWVKEHLRFSHKMGCGGQMAEASRHRKYRRSHLPATLPSKDGERYGWEGGY